MDPKLLTGTVELLILDVIGHSSSYGYEITQTVLFRSDGQFELKEGSLYSALHRLERQKQLSSYWSEHDGRRRKYYQLTSAGRKSLAAKRAEWTAFAAGVNGVLGLNMAEGAARLTDLHVHVFRGRPHRRPAAAAR